VCATHRKTCSLASAGWGGRCYIDCRRKRGNTIKMQLPTPPLSNHIPHALLRNVSHKPSAPIEIPRARKSNTRSFRSPSLRQTSPDMIFEMSPLNGTSVSPLSSHFPLASNHHDILSLHGRQHGPNWHSTSSRPSSSPHEPFMYCFPRLPPAPSQPAEKARLLEVPKSPILTEAPANVSSIGRSHRRAHSYLTSACLRNEDEDEFSTCSHTKLFASSLSIPDLKPPVRALPYPKQKPSKLISPPVPVLPLLPYRGFQPADCEKEGENVSPDGTTPSPLDFEKYMIHRIEDEKAVRIRRSRTISSMRVRFGDDINRALEL